MHLVDILQMWLICQLQAEIVLFKISNLSLYSSINESRTNMYSFMLHDLPATFVSRGK